MADFDPNSLLGMSFNVQNVGLDEAVVNGQAPQPNDISLVNGVYTVAPVFRGPTSAFQSDVANTSGGASSSEPADQYEDTSLKITYANSHTVNTNPQPNDPPVLETISFTGYSDSTPQPSNPFLSGGFAVVGVAKNAAGVVTDLLLERWDSFDLTTGIGNFQGNEGYATNPRTFFIFSTVNNFFVEENTGTVPAALNFQQVTCFAEGSRIATPDSYAAVEDLRAGDLVRTASGADRAVVWVGRRTVECSLHPAPETVWPVRVQAGAFAQGVPARDLFLSPDHAVLVDGALVPVRLLINRGTIAQVERKRVTYLHVELASHDVLLAEGLAAESYLDTGNRGLLDASQVQVALHPDFSGAGAQALRASGSCAPFATDAARVRPIWERLAERSAARGHLGPDLQATSDAELRLIVDGREIRPASRDGDDHCFVLPPAWTQARLVSRSERPSDAAPWLDDRRMLGVRVSRILFHADGACAAVALDDPSLVSGWWPQERDASGPYRWTDGDALMPAWGGAGLLRVACRPGTYDVANANMKRAVYA